MVAGDIPAGLSLCRSAGWNQTRDDWELFLSLSPLGCCVAVEDEGHVIGTVATIKYQDHFSWIGMVLVDPAMQRQGIGIQLLRESLRILSEEDTVKLDATPAGRKVYVQLNFVDEYPLSRMEIDQIVAPTLPLSEARPVTGNDLPAILEFDRKVFGAGRELVIGSLMERAPQLAFVLEDNAGIRGYCFGRIGHKFAHIGPVIAADHETAIKVVSSAMRNCAGRPIVLDALHHTPAWLEWLASLGFKVQRTLTRMYRGANAFPGIPGQQFAILGPEFG